jgi:hypothetical protein
MCSKLMSCEGLLGKPCVELMLGGNCLVYDGAGLELALGSMGLYHIQGISVCYTHMTLELCLAEIKIILTQKRSETDLYQISRDSCVATYARELPRVSYSTVDDRQYFGPVTLLCNK